MNTAIKAVSSYEIDAIFTDSPFGKLKDILLNRNVWAISFLLVTIFISALSIIYIQDQNRMFFSQLTSLQKNNDALHMKYGQLLLEESTWSEQSRIEHVAATKLHMHVPKQQNIIIVPK